MKTKLFLIFAITFSLNACVKDMTMVIPSETADERFNKSMEWNLQHPSPEVIVTSDEYSLFCVADCHVGGTKNIDSFFSLANSSTASAIVMVGDITTGHAQDYEKFKTCLPKQTSMPLFFIAGNHDEFFGGWEQFNSKFGTSTYLFTVATPNETDLYICLDSGGGTLGAKQLKWFENTLQTKRSAYRNCFVFTHVNLFRPRHTTSTNPFVEEIKVLVGLFTKYQVDMVITGHDHVRADQLFGITRYIQLDALEDNAPNAGYFILKVREGKIEYSFEKI
jgi:UDP-2,3-diacylglucosamine pyrophosphatase LpxH